MRVVFLGAPGAGKGTQAALLGERLQIAHLSSGDLLREAQRRGDPIGRQAERFMEKGILVPDALVTELMVRHVEALGQRRSFVLDGFPRTVDQAKALDAALKQKDSHPIDLAVDFEISPEKVVTRLSGRRVCESCGAVYHLDTLPPKRQGSCDRCNTALTARPDDQPETIRRRLKVYRDQTEPLLSFYRGQGKLRAVPGELEIDQQYQALLNLLRKEQLLR